MDFDLREWAELSSTRPTMLTVYLDTRHGPDLKFLIRRGREIRGLYDGDLRRNFLAAMKKTRQFLDDEENVSGRGIAIMVDPSQDLFRHYVLPRSVGNLVTLDTSAYIRPLARLEDDWEPFGLCLLDNSHAQLYLVDLSRVTDMKSLKTDVLGSQKNGGWSQARYSRRRKNQIDDFLRQVASELSSLLRKERVNRIVLAGSAEAKRQLVDFLPRDMQRKVIGFLDVSADTDENTLLKKTFPIFFEAEKLEEGRLIQNLRDCLASGGLAVAGLDDTALAVARGRAERILVQSDLKPAGWKCERCDVMEEGEEKECVLCGETVYPVDVVEEIVEYAAKTSAEVVFVEEKNQLLEAMGNIGAFLRY